jgi:hypothetical protein
MGLLRPYKLHVSRHSRTSVGDIAVPAWAAARVRASYWLVPEGRFNCNYARGSSLGKCVGSSTLPLRPARVGCTDDPYA